MQRLKKPVAISLLHGARGVGKTRLLEEFANKRLVEGNSIFIKFKPDNVFEIDGQEFSDYLLLEKFITKLKQKTIVFLDQFDHAPIGLQQTIIKYWSSEVGEKHLSLVISIESESIPQISEIARKFSLHIDSVELKPLTYNEQLEYLTANCCQGLRQTLLLSSKLKKILNTTGGFFSHLETFRLQYGHEFICQEKKLSGHWVWSNRVYYGVFIILTSLLTFAFYNSIKESNSIPLIVTEVSNSNVDDDLTDQAKIAELTTEAKSGFSNQQIKKSFVDPDEFVMDYSLKQVHSEPPKLIEESHLLPLKNLQSRPQLKTVSANDNLSFLNKRLIDTKAWLNSVNNNLASIQIMTVVYDEEHQYSLNRYIESLQKDSIDIDKIKIYQLKKKNKIMYGVVYGEYADIKIAGKVIKNLPDKLKVNKPFPRTIKGIKDEVINH